MGKQTYLMRTTGFERSEFDEGYEYFAIDLDYDEVERLLGLVKTAKKLSKTDPDFKYLLLEDSAGLWLSVEDVKQAIGHTIDEFDDKDHLAIPVDPIKVASSDSRLRELFIKPDGVFWLCNPGAGEADWIVESSNLSEFELIRLRGVLEIPPTVFK